MHSLALLPNLAGPDGIVILLFLLLFFGAKKLPELAKGLGQAVKEFSRAKDDINGEFNRATQIPDYSHHPHAYPDPGHPVTSSTPGSPQPAASTEPVAASNPPPAAPAPVTTPHSPAETEKPAAEKPRNPTW
jgi:sec-independent protein translocase protein TatA